MVTSWKELQYLLNVFTSLHKSIIIKTAMEGFHGNTTRVSENVSFATNENNKSSVIDGNIRRSSLQLSTKTAKFLFYMEFWGSLEYISHMFLGKRFYMAVVKFDYLHRKASNILILSLSIADGLLGECYISFSFLN